MPWTTAVLTAFALTSVVVSVLWARSRRELTVIRAENLRWRELAQHRADRVAMLSHEVRTPLALISGSTELLTDETAGPVNERQHRLLNTIEVNSRLMQALAQDLLTEARIDSGDFVLRAQKVDLRRVVQDAVDDLRGLYDNRIVIDTPGAPPELSGDPQLLRQALVNLITNAVRHGGPGATVHVRARRTESGVLVTVSDDGTGMDEAQQAALFRRTMAGKSPTGNGLGMIITRKIVQLHDGRLVIDTVSAHGTRVMMSLPRSSDEN
ncbi:His Kinase A (phospho-acceptor) domain-containing protein [Austwickia chelonae]|uniref:histidine kinase n=1 Tax=Austwickia chelonae NBRC 105200 TaxID=1184607 RepID=K6W5L9_9MICO|nr:HAMP domain-containing sensor histidine kinase [Austwickia chelonae]GAB77117.1 putative two-component sensor histidine kinase [Austwickia chelonae NBRC 105200]SEW03156.1 His Kinase A (phospho-acceptor) domain-containing protein [Austwickia chelonae]